MCMCACVCLGKRKRLKGGEMQTKVNRAKWEREPKREEDRGMSTE